jgi:hypothetical protein
VDTRPDTAAEAAVAGGRGGRLVAFIVPPVTALLLLYHALAGLQITVMRRETLIVILSTFGGSIVVGLIAAFGGRRARVLVLSVVALLWLDMAVGLPTQFDALTPETRRVSARDRQRVADIHTLQSALERYIAQYGALPRPGNYGEGYGRGDFWEGWWDVSSNDGNGDGRFFLDFLLERGVLSAVPLDPDNTPSPDGHPARGRQYVYFVAPEGYEYGGGRCDQHSGYSTYVLAVTDLEREAGRPPRGVSGSGCECLWRDNPDFFQPYFDYLVCGRFKP